MPTSIISKKKIAKAFKELLATKEFEKISIRDIMDLADMRRQTFYKHFLDKYDLLEWIFKNELQEQIIDNLNYISGIGLLHEVFYFFEQNKSFYKELFAIQSQNDFLSYFQDYCLQLVVKIVAEYHKQEQLAIPKKEKNFFFQYHAAALAQTIKRLLQDPNSDFFEAATFTESVLYSFLEYYTLEGDSNHD